MIPATISTELLPFRDQFGAWHDWFGSIFDVTPRQSIHGGFLAKSQIWQMDGFAVSRASNPSVRVARTKSLIRRNPVDHWVVTLSNEAETRIQARGALLKVPSGMPFILSMKDEVVSERSQDERVSLYLAREAFPEIAARLDAACGSILDTPMGQLLSDYMLLLERRLPDLAPADLSQLTNAVHAMVGACIVPSPERLAAAAEQIDLGRMEKVRQIVRSHLRSSSLGPALVCRLMGVSRSQLYRMFESESGVTRYIQRQRLLGAHAALQDVRDNRPVAAISEELCFADASSFSRAFRREFGVSPRDVRAAALVGLVPSSTTRRDIQTGSFNLSDCLRGL